MGYLLQTSFKKLLTPSVKRKLEKMAVNMAYLERRGDLKSRHNDEDDFVDMAVWTIESLVQEAYLMGYLDRDQKDLYNEGY